MNGDTHYEEMYLYLSRALGKRVVFGTWEGEFEGVLRPDGSSYEVLYRDRGKPQAVSVGLASHLDWECETFIRTGEERFSTNQTVSSRPLYGIESALARWVLWRKDIPPNSFRTIARESPPNFH